MILRSEYTREAEESAAIAWREGMALRERLNPAEWAQQKRWIAQGASPLSSMGAIRYDVSRLPHCEEPMVEAVSPDVQVMILDWASGLGKTETCLNIIGFKIEHAPTNQFIVYPKDESGRKFSRDVLQRMIDSTPAINKVVVEAKSRDSGNTLTYKKYLGGSLYVTAARSASNFRGPRAGVVWCDEIDGFPSSVGGEGDPISLAFKRAEGFEDSIKLLSGTPTLKNHSNIENWLLKSDRRVRLVPCRRCDRLQLLMWRHKRSDIAVSQATVVWPQTGRNRLEKAVILCAECGASHNDGQRLQMIHDGQWKPTLPFNGIRGYWLNGINTTLPAEKGFKHKLHQMAVDAHNAANSNNKRETTRMWTNTFLAETFQEEQDVKQEWQKMWSRREEWPTVSA
jgi:phage terminase large subunit GpA-like protein